jgi:molecular chaperone GrpE (heat shock protein)
VRLIGEKRRSKNEASSQASQLSQDSANAKERKLRVEGEINGYPARKDILTEEMAAHERGLDEILFPLQGHLDQLSALEATARDARSKNVEAQESVRSSIGMIRNKY